MLPIILFRKYVLGINVKYLIQETPGTKAITFGQPKQVRVMIIIMMIIVSTVIVLLTIFKLVL